MLISEALNKAQTRLTGLSDAPELDACWLLLHVLDVSEVSWLHAHGDDRLATEMVQRFDALVDERAAGKPLAYLIGWWEFYGRRFLVTGDVLIPRPSTEALVDAALRYVVDHQPRTIADVGTGSGCVAITLACELEQKRKMQKCKILATDISPAALGIARENADRHGVAHRIEFLQGDLLEPLAGYAIDLIVSNPPYVPAEALAKAGQLSETRGLTFEPQIALNGGPDGGLFTRQLLNQNVPTFVETTGGGIHDTLSRARV